MEDLTSRISHLRNIDSIRYELSIRKNETELAKLKKEIGKDVSILNEVYTSFLAMKPSKKDFEHLISDLRHTSFSKKQFLELVRASSFCTICPSSVMPDGLEKCKD